MRQQNIPVEILSKFSASGEITPLRIRLEDQNHHLVTANISNIVYAAENHLAGIKTFDYACRVVSEEREQLLELRYFVDAHKWVIKKVLY